DDRRNPRRDAPAGVRHLPRPPAHGARLGREDHEDEVRPSRREPPGEGPRHRARGHHQPEPRLRRRSFFHFGKPATDPRVALRRFPPGTGAHGSAGVLLSRASGSESGAARHRVSLRSLREDDGRCTKVKSLPKRTDLKSILIIGAGPIVIGQACEFDYSGAQACKALRAEGYRVVLGNSNPATIMTDPQMADATYIEPVTWQTVARIIEKERPDALLPTMGGQTALNCALDLAREGVLENFGVQMIGASREAIDKAEDREKFK